MTKGKKIFRKILSSGSVETVFKYAKLYIRKDSMWHNLKEVEWCLRRCAELGDERAMHILSRYELTGDLEAAFWVWQGS